MKLYLHRVNHKPIRKRRNNLSKKIYIVDTNVLMYAGRKALEGFGNNEVVIPFVVVEELEKKRNTDSSDSFMARYALRVIDTLRESGNLNQGVPINKFGGTVRIEMNHVSRDSLHKRLQNDINDNRLLAVAQNLHNEQKLLKEKDPENYREVILVSRDTPLRLKADTFTDLKVENFHLNTEEFDGILPISITREEVDQLYQTKNQGIKASDQFLNLADGVKNHAFVLQLEGANKGVALLQGNKVKAVTFDNAIQKLKGKSVEQKIALSYLLDEDRPIISLGGPAGTGKTLLSVVTAMDLVDKEKYNKISVIRPMYPVGGQEVGHLPGDLNDKMAEWRKPIYDSVEGIVDKSIVEKLQENDKLDVMPVTYIRGRTFNNSFIIVDEAQNFEPSVLLTILSRVGHGSKIVFCWDATQKDNNRLGYNEGIISIVEKLKTSDLFTHLSLRKSERSNIAELAGEILMDYIK